MKKKLKIGVFLNSKNKFNDGQIKIIYDIIHSKHLKLKYIFEYEKQNNFKLVDNLILKVISLIEKKYSLVTRTNKLSFIKKYFLNINKYYLDEKKFYSNLKKKKIILKLVRV